MGTRRSRSWTDGLARRWLLVPAAVAGAAIGSSRPPHDPARRATAAQPAAVWVADGRPTRQALAVVRALHDAPARGLRPDDYDADALDAQARLLAAGAPDGAAAARFDAALDRALVRYLTHLHMGRVRPAAVGLALPDAHRDVHVDALARAVSRAGDVAAAIAAAEPPYAGYAALVRALARYRALAADDMLRPPALPARAVRPGASFADAAALRRLLVALGDLPARAAVPGDTLFDSALVAGVRAFQERHGLDVDGVIGPATGAQLRVPLERRVTQLELSLERWRWLPDVAPRRFAVVNVPAFRLALFLDDPALPRPALRMKVIVGEAQGRRNTPVFVATMREVIFRPYWDVPPSIAANELLPRIRRDPGYLDRNDLEFVRDDGTLRLRQRPGPRNALGLVKFVLPNAYNVYLHDTPTQELFARARRDFSHGCIRVERPAALAEYVLRGQPGWDGAAVDSAMHGERTLRVRLDRPVSVFILYATAVVRDDGAVRFYSDIYGRDADLARALAARDAVSATGR